MKIYRYNESNFTEAAKLLADEGLVGFDVFPSRAQEVFDFTLQEFANIGFNCETVVKDFALTEDGYVYILRNQEVMDDTTSTLLTQLEYARMYAN